MDPLTIGLVTSGIGGLLGGFGANAKAKEAARREKINGLLGSADTRFSPYVSARSTKLAESDAGPGMVGGIASGLLSGFSQGQKLSGMGLAKGGFEKIADGTQKVADLAGEGYGADFNPWSAMSPVKRTNVLDPSRMARV